MGDDLWWEWPQRKVAFGVRGLMREVTFGVSGLIKGLALGGSVLI